MSRTGEHDSSPWPAFIRGRPWSIALTCHQDVAQPADCDLCVKARQTPQDLLCTIDPAGQLVRFSALVGRRGTIQERRLSNAENTCSL